MTGSQVYCDVRDRAEQYLIARDRPDIGTRPDTGG
jgi:hypothetical protein